MRLSRKYAVFAAVLGVLIGGSIAYAAFTLENVILATNNPLSALTTELNSLGNNSYTAVSGVLDPRIGQTGVGYIKCNIEGVFTFAANPTANTGVTVWFVMSIDGTNYENTPTSSVGLGRNPDVILPATTGQLGTRVTIKGIDCPAERFKAVAKNDGTGQAMSASGNTIKIHFYTPQGN